MTPDLEARFEPLRANISHAGVFLDFDGTLAPIVDDPATARPLDGVAEALATLARSAGAVAVLSGRPVAFLRDTLQVPSGVEFHGLYGLQTVVDGEVHEPPEATRWHRLIDLGATAAESQLPESVHVERKGVSFVLHYRTSPALEDACKDWAAGFVADSGLDAHSGRLSIEIGPLSLVDKGRRITELCSGLAYACAMGDDVGDVPMFEATKAALPKTSLNVLVASVETPASLRGASDVEVSGPEEALELIRYLAE